MDWVIQFLLDHVVNGGVIGWGAATVYLAATIYGSRGKWEPLWETLKSIAVDHWVIVLPLLSFFVALFRSTMDGKYTPDEMTSDRRPLIDYIDSLVSTVQQIYAIMVPGQVMTIVAKRALAWLPIGKPKTGA